MHETSDLLLYSNIFIYQVLCTLIYRRRSLHSFLIDNFVITPWSHGTYWNHMLVIRIKIYCVPSKMVHYKHFLIHWCGVYKDMEETKNNIFSKSRTQFLMCRFVKDIWLIWGSYGQTYGNVNGRGNRTFALYCMIALGKCDNWWHLRIHPLPTKQLGL